jgi:hypothetical protein
MTMARRAWADPVVLTDVKAPLRTAAAVIAPAAESALATASVIGLQYSRLDDGLERWRAKTNL